MKKFKMGAFLLAFAFWMGMVPAVLAQAEGMKILEILQAEERIETKVEPKENAKAGKVYEAGELLLIVGSEDSKWYAVAYQGDVYYIKKSENLKLKVPVMQVEDKKEVVVDEAFKEQLKAEMEVGAHEGKAYVESYIRYQEETAQKRIWGAIIGVLVVAIIGVSIYSYVSGKKEERKE